MKTSRRKVTEFDAQVTEFDARRELSDKVKNQLLEIANPSAHRRSKLIKGRLCSERPSVHQGGRIHI